MLGSKKWLFFLLLGLMAFADKNLNVAIDGLTSVQLVLRDPLMGNTIEKYNLAKDQHAGFVNALNNAVHQPNLKMTSTCYEFVLKYKDGTKRQLSTNGKGIGPTAFGSFMASENLVVKFFDISKENLCKPKDPANTPKSDF